MSTINPTDVKSLRDVRTLLNEVDNKLIEQIDVLQAHILKIELNADRIQRDGADIVAVAQNIEQTCKSMRSVLYEDNRTL